MKISVRNSIGQGWTYDFDIASSIRIHELKQRLRENIGDDNLQMTRLVFNGQQLDDDHTVSDYDIRDGSVLELINPPWRRTGPGLCLEGECTNSGCDAYRDIVIMPIGYRKFDMSIDPNETTTKCPACKKYVRPDTCGFTNCWWKYDGTKDCGNEPPQSCSSDWERADDAYHSFDEQQSGIIKWRKLIFEAVEERPSGTHGQSSATSKSSPSSATAAAAIPSNQSRHSLNKDESDAHWSAKRDKAWYRGDLSSCSNRLIVRGQGTVEIMQKEEIPFELRLSNSKNPHDGSAYSIILSVKKEQIKLSTSTGQSYESIDPLHTLQSEDGSWHRYWISFYEQDGNVKYGVGEIRSLFAVFDVVLPQRNKAQSVEKIQYLHMKLNNNNQELDHLKEKFRFYIGKKPVSYDSPLFVVPNELYLLKHAVHHTAIPPSQLENPCRDLYDGIINFKLNDADFPDFTDCIEKSIKNTNGWCRTKLMLKSSGFGARNLKTTYLRLTLGKQEGNAPGHQFVVEIWPPGHLSPVHSHSNAYAIIRVLHGEILLKLYPELRLNVKQYQPFEQICHEGQVTWILPNLNQTHQLKHVDLYGKCCITIQCYIYGSEDREHYECFDYIASDGKSIRQFDPKSDMDFYEFKDLMQREKQNGFQYPAQ